MRGIIDGLGYLHSTHGPHASSSLRFYHGLVTLLAACESRYTPRILVPLSKVRTASGSVRGKPVLICILALSTPYHLNAYEIRQI